MDKAKKTKKIIYWVLIAVFATIFIVSSTIVVDYIKGSQEHQEQVENLQSLRGTRGERPTAPSTPSASTVPGSSSVTTTPSTAPSQPTVPSDPAVPSDPTVPVTNPTVPSTPVTVPTTPPTAPTTPVIVPTTPPTAPTTPTTVPTAPPTAPTTPTTVPTTPPTEPPKPTVPTKPPHVELSILSDLLQIYNLNNDVVGWVKINGTNIDYPVVQTKKDPSYYLYRDFYKKDDVHGSIYAEAVCDVFSPSDVVTIYGHRMADQSMFHNIQYYTVGAYFNTRNYIYFDTLYHYRKYEVVLLFRTNGEPHKTYPFFPFHTYSNFKNEADFDYFMSSIRELAVRESGVEVKYGDKLLCLCTCDYYPYPNGRLVLVAKLVEEYR